MIFYFFIFFINVKKLQKEYSTINNLEDNSKSIRKVPSSLHDYNSLSELNSTTGFKFSKMTIGQLECMLKPESESEESTIEISPCSTHSELAKTAEKPALTDEVNT